MVKDISEELYKKIKESFDKKYGKAQLLGEPLHDVFARIQSGTATFRDADMYAVEVGSMLSDSLKEHLTLDEMPNRTFYRNIAKKTLGTSLKDGYGMVSNIAAVIQEEMNEAAGIGLKAVKPKLEVQAVDKVVDGAVQAKSQEELDVALTEPVKTFTRKVVDDTQKANVRLHNKVGLSVKVEREYDGVGLHDGTDVCDWCKQREGTWTYDKAMANGVFERHEGCGCIITYTSAKGEVTRGYGNRKSWTWEEANKRNERIGLERERIEIAKIREKNILERQISNDIMQVSTKTRNDIPLTKEQIEMCYKYAVSLGMPRELIVYSDTVNTGYFDLSGKLYIGTDVLPRENSTNVNGRLSYRSAIAHELVGHRETCLRGTNFPAGSPEDEAQASIRAARFAEGLTQKDRYMLIKDGISRLKNSGIRINNIKRSLDIWER